MPAIYDYTGSRLLNPASVGYVRMVGATVKLRCPGP